MGGLTLAQRSGAGRSNNVNSGKRHISMRSKDRYRQPATDNVLDGSKTKAHPTKYDEGVDWSKGVMPADQIIAWREYFDHCLNSNDQSVWIEGLFNAIVEKVVVQRDEPETDWHVWMRFKIEGIGGEKPLYAYGRWYFPCVPERGDLHISQLLRPWLTSEDMQVNGFNLYNQVGRKCQVMVRMQTYTTTEGEGGYIWKEHHADPVVQLVLPADYRPFTLLTEQQS